jgi:putative ABC transport system substrate-binding protein
MIRRQFVTLLGGAIAWPSVARAQQSPRARRIGVLMGLAAGDPESQARLAAFAQGLQQAGWVVGQNVRIDYRWGAGNADTMKNTRRNWSPRSLTSSSRIQARP